MRGGNTIYANDVEGVLIEHSGILEAAVAGLPHPVRDEDVAAFVVALPDVVLDPADIETICHERLTDSKCPRRITLVDSLPRNPTGKAFKHQLPI